MECGFSGYCECDAREKPPNLDCSLPRRLDPPPEPDRYVRPSGGFENDFSGVCDRRKNDWSSGDGRAGAEGGDMAAEADVGALPNKDDGDGRENNDEPVSRAGRSASEPSMAEMDMLLPCR